MRFLDNFNINRSSTDGTFIICNGSNKINHIKEALDKSDIKHHQDSSKLTDNIFYIWRNGTKYVYNTHSVKGYINNFKNNKQFKHINYKDLVFDKEINIKNIEDNIDKLIRKHGSI